MTQYCIIVSTRKLDYLLCFFFGSLRCQSLYEISQVYLLAPQHVKWLSHKWNIAYLSSVQESPNLHLQDVMWTGISKWEPNINHLVEQMQAQFSHWSGSSGYFYCKVQFQVSKSTDIFECSGLYNILHHSMWPACLKSLSTHHNYYLSNTRLLVEHARVLSPPLAIQ
jgi:hypothetical protein